MRKTINRAEFVQALESLKPGLSPREQVQQSSCFAFLHGEIITFNEQVSCRIKSPLSKKLEAAISAKPLLAILNKLTEETVDVEARENEITFYGRRKRVDLRIDPEVTLPISGIETPTDWHPLHDNFNEAVEVVSQCCKKESDKWKYTCVHVHPKWIEATDNIQICRYRLATGFTESILVRGEAVRAASGLDMTEFSESPSWLHLRNPTGLTLSCRRWVDTYFDMTPFMKVVGESIKLPKKLAKAVENAELFTAEMKGVNRVTVQLTSGKVRIRGEGLSGKYAEYSGLTYVGPDLEFLVTPAILREIITKHSLCHVSEDKLCVVGDDWKYFVSLYKKEKPA